jgi:hypothetical protein
MPREQHGNDSQLLQLIHKLSGGDTDSIIGRKGLGQPLGFSGRETKVALRRMQRRGWIRPILFRSLCITHAGIAAAQQLEPVTGKGTPIDTGAFSLLRETLATRLSDSELRTLCFDLNLDYEDLAGTNKPDRARELVTGLIQRERIDELAQVGARLRPDICWDEICLAGGSDRT